MIHTAALDPCLRVATAIGALALLLVPVVSEAAPGPTFLRFQCVGSCANFNVDMPELQLDGVAFGNLSKRYGKISTPYRRVDLKGKGQLLAWTTSHGGNPQTHKWTVKLPTTPGYFTVPLQATGPGVATADPKPAHPAGASAATLDTKKVQVAVVNRSGAPLVAVELHTLNGKIAVGDIAPLHASAPLQMHTGHYFLRTRVGKETRQARISRIVAMHGPNQVLEVLPSLGLRNFKMEGYHLKMAVEGSTTTDVKLPVGGAARPVPKACKPYFGEWQQPKGRFRVDLKLRKTGGFALRVPPAPDKKGGKSQYWQGYFDVQKKPRRLLLDVHAPQRLAKPLSLAFTPKGRKKLKLTLPDGRQVVLKRMKQSTRF